MGKGDSKASRKKTRKPLPELAGVPKRQPNGRLRRASGYISDRNAEKTVLQARARQSGKSQKDLGEMRATHYGEAAGSAIYAIYEGETAKRLWGCYRDMSAAYKRFLLVCMGASLDAKTAKIEMMPDAFETSASDTPDLRDEEEKHRAAANAWHRWRVELHSLPLNHVFAIYAALHNRCPLMDGGSITSQGRRFVEAMKAFDKAGSHV